MKSRRQAKKLSVFLLQTGGVMMLIYMKNAYGKAQEMPTIFEIRFGGRMGGGGRRARGPD